jgi:hypothetical protein
MDDEDGLMDLIKRYQACAYRIWELFPADPLPEEDMSHFMIERLESILNRGLLVPKSKIDQLERELGELRVERDRSEANAFMASQREMRKIGENNELRERMNNLLAQQKEIIP